MEHVAILKKQWKLVDKIITGQKTIESRWYLVKTLPWDKIHEDEIVYFKESGGPVIAKAEVSQVIQYYLTPEKVEELFNNYGERIGIEPNQLTDFINRFRNKKYCILVFLKKPRRIEPFYITKEGFGNATAWISVNNVDSIKLSNGL